MRCLRLDERLGPPAVPAGYLLDRLLARRASISPSAQRLGEGASPNRKSDERRDGSGSTKPSLDLGLRRIAAEHDAPDVRAALLGGRLSAMSWQSVVESSPSIFQRVGSIPWR